MKRFNKLFMLAIITLVTFIANIAYASDEYRVKYTIDEPVEGAPIPTMANASFFLEGEPQGTLDVNLYWYEVDGESYKKVNYARFKAGKTYRVSIVDINFTTTTPEGSEYEIPGPAYSNCSFIGKGTNIETDSTHLYNAFRCEYSLIEVINGESGQVFSIPNKKVKDVNIIIDTEIAGTTAEKGEKIDGCEGDSCYLPGTFPSVILDGFVHIGDEVKPYYISAYPSESENYDAPFFGTFIEGEEYYIEVYIQPNEGYEFDENTVIRVNGKKTDFEESEWATPLATIIYAKFKATSPRAIIQEYKVLDGNNQVVKKDEPKVPSFRFDINFEDFVNYGKIWFDGKEMTWKFYDSREGSTIITLKKEFVDTLEPGEHTIKVVVADGEATAKFTIQADTKNPKTNDNIMIYISLLGFSILGLLSVYNYKKIINII